MNRIERTPNTLDAHRLIWLAAKQVVQEAVSRIILDGPEITSWPEHSTDWKAVEIIESSHYRRPVQHQRYRTPTFSGRRTEIESALTQIHEGTTQLAFVSMVKGLGGIGKTTLAAEIAELLNQADRLPAGIL